MKRNKLLWIVIPIGGILIAAIVAVAVLFLTFQKKESRYNEQLNSARIYMEQADYTKMIAAYEAAIELKPEEPEAYISLAEYYIENGKFYEADEIAALGLLRTNNATLQDLILFIDSQRQEAFAEQAKEKLLDENEARKESVDTGKLLLRNTVIGMIGDYCYQQYVNEYAQSDVNYVSAEEGYRVRFKGLNIYAYFMNTSTYREMVDEYSKKPMPKAKPYKVEVLSPDVLFMGFEGYVDSARLAELFHITPESVLTEEDGISYLVFDYLGCSIKMETDAQGNIVKENPIIELYPLNLVSDWEEEEEEEEEPVDDGTFVLAGETYTYDVDQLYITDAVLDDLTPLSQCKKLRLIVFFRCEISNLSPLSGCTALEELNLQGSVGNLDLSCLSDLSSLRYLGFHECRDIDDISPIMDLELELFHPCGSSVSYEQCVEYQNRHPDCEVWFDYYVMR